MKKSIKCSPQMFKGGGAAAGGDKGAEAKKEVEELVLEPITIDFLKQV